MRLQRFAAQSKPQSEVLAVRSAPGAQGDPRVRGFGSHYFVTCSTTSSPVVRSRFQGKGGLVESSVSSFCSSVSSSYGLIRHLVTCTACTAGQTSVVRPVCPEPVSAPSLRFSNRSCVCNHFLPLFVSSCQPFFPLFVSSCLQRGCIGVLLVDTLLSWTFLLDSVFQCFCVIVYMAETYTFAIMCFVQGALQLFIPSSQ